MRKRILVIEDNEIDRYVVNRLLVGLYDLEFALTTHQAMLKLLRTTYDVILLDLVLEESVNGLELATFFKQRSMNTTTPVIAMTSFGYHFVEAQVREAGCKSFLQKPLDSDSLIAAIETGHGVYLSSPPADGRSD